MLLSVLFIFSSFIVLYDFVLIFFFIPVISFLVLSWTGGFFDGVLMLDFLALVLLFVSVWVFTLSLNSMSLDILGLLTLWLMFASILFSFSFFNYLFFYISFEFSFLLMFFFLIGWGATSERLQASFYMFFYTMLFSLPFLVMLVDCGLNFTSSFLPSYLFIYGDLFWVFMFIVFMVKLPVLGFHLWLPKAHVEAPVAGSMILAGVLLKLGGYGLIRFLSSISFSLTNSFFVSVVFYLSLYGAAYTSFLCVRQMDLKMMIAYSSVVHMSVMLLGILSFTSWGLWGSVMMMVSHGFISPSLFYFMTYIYNVKSSRSILVLKGVLVLCPLFCFFWFLGCALNLSVPPFMSFYGEVCILGSLGFAGIAEWVFICLGCFLTGVYCVFMYTTVCHGSSPSPIPFYLSFKNIFLMCSHFMFIFSFIVVFFSF